ncbi:MAG: glucuronate isomerase, partial [Chitinivibrionales bacterium]|nr:glucuronate isomerase [Chitinivibrionales bacterium]MBD3355543.1 glucuronate isomerase [Chitinivibrionales bacterium]
MGNDVFIGDDFLLGTSTAQKLYHEYAKDLPIVDYHCHLPPRQIAEDTRFENLAQIWLYGDHYKWRQMRTNGIAERYCTGDAGDWEKFQAWAETVPKTLRNPLYHWTHLELKRPFGISDRLLGPETAKGIWDECNAKLADPSFSARGIMKRMNVALVCTTDDPTDTLEYHKAIAADPDLAVQVLPTFRPDKGMVVENVEAFNSWVDALAAVADTDIVTFSDFIGAVRKRHDYFAAMGCRLSDHGIETVCAEDYTATEIEKVFDEARSGKTPDPAAVVKFKSAMPYEFGLMDHEKGWTQQLHIGALRNNSTRMYRTLGPDTGFDSIGDCEIARPLSRFLDRLDVSD